MRKFKSVMFICHGNICRSPMAELIFRHQLEERGIRGVTVASSAVSREELGNPVYPPAVRELAKHGISAKGKYAVRLCADDYDRYDLLLCMDSSNVSRALRIIGEDGEGKVMRLLDLTERPRDVADPWYTGDFAATYRDITEGLCELIKLCEE